MKQCSFCSAPLHHVFADLGLSPLSNALVRRTELTAAEALYPLLAYVCDRCWLVQVEQVETPAKLFGDYVYFSSYSSSWLEHMRSFADGIVERLALKPGSSVIEVASNDGYLLKYFRRHGIQVLGIEPAANTAQRAVADGIPTIVRFLGTHVARELAADGKTADLLIGNNVLAHVPDLRDFVAGLKILLKPTGVLTMEFPHLLKMIERNEFDTIYHEHLSYFSLGTAQRVFSECGLTLFDVDEIPTHGGSLRVYLTHSERPASPQPSVQALLDREVAAGLHELSTYSSFSGRIQRVKAGLLDFLRTAKSAARSVVGYGAPAKATTLLNYCGINCELMKYTVDRSPHKQGRYVPGVRMPIENPSTIFATRPDYLVILAWNLADEIEEQMAGIESWGGRFVVPIPSLRLSARPRSRGAAGMSLQA
ncbi:MAG: class I SAM-dependent methyltransferase [Candidatus Eremiobacteraeota bacterium]|nr:class I SAM-dependent methyltransferase [Candidatus Eremiobacteraeota bacterium]